MCKTLQLQIRVSAEEKNIIKRRAKAANKDISSWVLSHILPPKNLQFQELISSMAKTDKQDQSYILAELNSLLTALPAAELKQATENYQPAVGLPPLLSNYIAAMVEYSTHLKHIPAPNWTKDIPPLEKPYFCSDLESLRIHLLINSPLPFRKRNIFIDSTIGAQV